MPMCPRGRRAVLAALLALVHATVIHAASNDRSKLRLDKNEWPESGTRPWLQDLPPLPASHGPASSQWTNSVAICAVMKDENITDVVEWLEYHRWLEVDHIFLTDNNSTDGARARAQLAAVFPSSFLTLRHEPEARGQLKTYAWCAEEQRAAYNWLGFIDLDEFIILRQKPKPGMLKKMLNEFKNEAGLSMHWIVVGPSERIARPEAGGVLRHYKRCDPQPHPAIKTIANTYFLKGLSTHPHNFAYRAGKFSNLEDGRKMRPKWHVRPHFWEAGGDNADCVKSHNLADCFVEPGERIHPATANRIALFHYITRSFEDFEAKLRRGAGVPFFTRDEAWFRGIEESERDDPICKEASALYDECCTRAPALAAAAVRAGEIIHTEPSPTPRRRTHRHTVERDGGVAWQPRDDFAVVDAGAADDDGGDDIDIDNNDGAAADGDGDDPLLQEAGQDEQEREGDDAQADGDGGGEEDEASAGGGASAAGREPMQPARDEQPGLDDLVDDLEGEVEEADDEAAFQQSPAAAAMTDAQRVELVGWRRKPNEPKTPGDQFLVTPAMRRRREAQKKAKKTKARKGKGRR